MEPYYEKFRVRNGQMWLHHIPWNIFTWKLYVVLKILLMGPGIYP